MKNFLTTALTVLLLSTNVANADSPLSGMPPLLNQSDIYAADGPNNFSPVVKNFPHIAYVPNHTSNTLTEIAIDSRKVIATYKMKPGPQHVVPSWDLKTLWVNNNSGNYLTPVDPANGKPGKPIYVHDPYNLYFTPNGKYAIVMAEADQQLVFRDPHTMAIKKKVNVKCKGLNHADWTKDGNYFVATCEFTGQLIWVNTAKMKVEKYADIPRTKSKNIPMPQDVKISPDGSTFYIADMMSNGVWTMPAARFGSFGFIPTGIEAHGLYVTRDSKYLVISNRGEGSVSLLQFSNNKIVSKMIIPGGGSPDMGGISADGKEFWVSGRYNGVVYIFDLEHRKYVKSIKVGKEPHGLALYPQPGRYSLGHTGIFR
jgi:DNA-binding beta-propeller fold protein YncE